MPTFEKLWMFLKDSGKTTCKTSIKRRNLQIQREDGIGSKKPQKPNRGCRTGSN